MRRVLMLALLLYVGASAWMLTARFIAAGEDLAATVDRVVAHHRYRLTDVSLDTPVAAGGIDFIECFGCDPVPGADGLLFAMLGLVGIGTPLAITALSWRRQAQAGAAPPASEVAQGAAILQAASLALSVWIAPSMLVVLAYELPSLVALAIGAVAATNVVLGVPACYAWRDLYARGFARRLGGLRLV